MTRRTRSNPTRGEVLIAIMNNPVDFGILQEQGWYRIPVGSADTIRVDITHIVRPWQSDSTLPQSLLLAVLPEAATLGEVRVLSSESNAAPSLHLTYVPLFLTEEL